MSKTVTASLVLAAVAAATLSAPVAGYQLHLTEAAGVTVVGSAAVDSTGVSCTIEVAGTYAASVVCVDAAGHVVTHSDGTPVVITGPAEPIVVTDPTVVMVNIPASFSVALA
jgi:hypothetical protein